jgi:hypothetical protein
LADGHDNCVPSVENSGQTPFQQVAICAGSRQNRAAFMAAQLKMVEVQVKVPLRDFRGGAPAHHYRFKSQMNLVLFSEMDFASLPRSN